MKNSVKISFISFISVLFIFLLGYSQVLGQKNYKKFNEYNYFHFKIGMTHSFFDKQPVSTYRKFIETETGVLNCYPQKRFFSYTTGISCGFTFTHDFKNINNGIILGAGFEKYGIKTKYKTADLQSAYIKEREKSVSLPLALYYKFPYKFRRKNDYFLNMQYLYTGINICKNWKINTETKLLLDNYKSKNKQTEILFNNNSIGFVAGINSGILNFEVKFIPSHFNSISDYRTDKEYLITSTNILFFTTNININIFRNNNPTWRIRRVLLKIIGGC